MVGRFNQSKRQFITRVATAIPEGTVEGNWRNDTTWVRFLPYINVAFSELDWDVYDRNIGEADSGSMADFRFTIHIFHSNCYEAGNEKGKYAQDVADRIKDVLLPFDSPQASNWWDVSGVTMRESEPEGGMHRISRVIVEGNLHVKRIDI